MTWFKKSVLTSRKCQKYGSVFLSLFGLITLAFAFVMMPYRLITAWNTGEIISRGRVYSRMTEPGEFWLTVGLNLFVIGMAILVLIALAWFFWVSRNDPINRRLSPLDRGLPIELTPEEKQKFERSVKVDDAKQSDGATDRRERTSEM